MAIRTAIDAELGPGAVEITVVDDGSGDDTARRARDAGADRVIELPVNRGKGAAVRAGVAASEGRTIVFTDADLAYAPQQIVRLVEAVEDGWDIVVGDRHHPDTETVADASALRSVGGRLVNAATRLVLVGGHRDTQCGLKAARSDVARLVLGRGRIDGFAFDVEIFATAEANGLSVLPVPVTVENSTTSTVRVVRDALRLLGDLVRVRLAARSGTYRFTDADLETLRTVAE